jgi:hypothetical protein
MGRRFLVLLLAAVLAGSTVGADSCGTSGSGGGSSTQQSKPHHQKRHHKKRRHKKRHATPQPQPTPAPTPAPKPKTQTQEEAACDPSYKGACLDPNASDYDCEGGSGDGPKYTGTVTVVGADHYDLDRDGDGVACEP